MELTLTAQLFARHFSSEDGELVLETLRKHAGLDSRFLYEKTSGTKDPKCILPMTSDELLVLEGRRQLIWMIESLRDLVVKAKGEQ